MTKVKIYIIVGVVFVVFLLVVSCMGAVDSGVDELDRNAQKSAESFYIEWEDGTTQEITDFIKGDEPRNTSTFTVVAKKAVTVEALRATAKDKPNASVTVIVSGDDELTYEFIIGDRYIFDPTFTVEEGTRITVTFTQNVSIVYLAVDIATK